MNSNAKSEDEVIDFIFTSDGLVEARKEISKYPENRQGSAVMPLLDIAQRECGGWIPRPAMDYIADLLEIPRIRVYEVATFYTMYNLEPVGDYHVQVCTNLPCWLRGSDKVKRTCIETLGIEVGKTTSNGKFTLSEVECLGACVNAPMMQINNDYFEDLDETSTASILTELEIGKKPKSGSQTGRVSCEPLGGLTSLKEESASGLRGK